MRKTALVTATLFFLLLSIAWKMLPASWITEDHKGYRLLYQEADRDNHTEYVKLIETGIDSVKAFFTDSFKTSFDIYIHPNRKSLDSQWQKDWHLPDFKSECWMVASGVGDKLDIISPKIWNKESCEHRYEDKKHTQQLVTHELIHVYHGQFNVSRDFSDTYNIDWFVEGLATFASGQCDKDRITEVKKLITDNKVPASLDAFWTGKLKYALSGSVLLFIDHKYGRTKLKNLLKFNKKAEILQALNTTEEELLSGWKGFIATY